MQEGDYFKFYILSIMVELPWNFELQLEVKKNSKSLGHWPSADLAEDLLQSTRGKLMQSKDFTHETFKLVGIGVLLSGFGWQKRMSKKANIIKAFHLLSLLTYPWTISGRKDKESWSNQIVSPLGLKTQNSNSNIILSEWLLKAETDGK